MRLPECIVKAIRIATPLAIVVSLNAHVFAMEHDAQAVSVVDRYVREHKHWKKPEYRIQRDRTEDHCIVFLIPIYPSRSESRLLVVARHLKPTMIPQREVIKEMRFQ